MDSFIEFAPYSSITCTFSVAFTSWCNLTSIFVKPNERIPSESILRLSILIPCAFCKLSATCFVEIEPNRRPPSPDFAFNCTVNASNLAFKSFAACNSAADCFSSKRF